MIYSILFSLVAAIWRDAVSLSCEILATIPVEDEYGALIPVLLHAIPERERLVGVAAWSFITVFSNIWILKGLHIEVG